jgi:glycosyltransferase involved in cell wall biosynthesis
MSAGVPVITSPVGGIQEVVVDGVTGFLVAPGDHADARAPAAQGTRRPGARRARPAPAGRPVGARLRYSPERAVPRLEMLYARIGHAAAGRRFRPAQPELKKGRVRRK